MDPAPTSTPHERLTRGAAIRRWLCKGLAFAAFALLVLNPNLKRAFLQLQHTLRPEALIQTQFSGLPEINAQIDRLVAADQGRHSEARLVARFVLKKIRYVTDYENWSNVEYWPTAEEVWQERQEDCDGRAILASSLLRARGFRSAHLVVGLDHMWIKVNENEKDSSRPAHFIALLSPNPRFSLDLHERSRFSDLVAIARALLHPGALRDTLTQLFADIPAFRKALLVVVLVLACYHPSRSRTGLLVLVATALTAVLVLAHWEPDQAQGVRGWSGFVLLVAALLGALFFERLRGARLGLLLAPASGPKIIPAAEPDPLNSA
jgi:hypothetical protein